MKHACMCKDLNFRWCCKIHAYHVWWSKCMNYSYKQSTPRWCNKRSIQENLSRESLKTTTQDNNIQTTEDDNIQNSWVRHCEHHSPVKNSSCPEIKVKFHEMPQKSRLFSKCTRIPLFLQLCICALWSQLVIKDVCRELLQQRVMTTFCSQSYNN